ncbi:Conserved_hypothetical protein [Hexamita inflata]|uniref:Uncharacterized protein n=1 Tax=Hexamita inflata TaxID=28002 RepID=A0AA86PDQ1_9EUKA|nr:Conserved hypothetical protein [Hexamita inflata]
MLSKPVRTIRPKINDNPGPGSYSPEKCFKHFVNHGVFTLKGRVNSPHKEALNMPGPGHYSPAERKVDTTHITSQFRPISHKPELIKATSPGPAAYTISSPKFARDFTLHSRVKLPEEKSQMSPQKYSPSYKSLEYQPQFTFKGRPKTSFEKERAPSPDAYLPKPQHHVLDLTMGKPSPHKSPIKNNGVPGPEKYTITRQRGQGQYSGSVMGVRWEGNVKTF